MKNYLLVGVVILLILSLFGVVKTFTTPAEITTNTPVKVLDYQQEGAFDYSVTAKPSYFYDNSPAATPGSIPQIPVKFIESFSLNYIYSPPPDSSGETIQINAILENPGVWQKIINLVPVQSATPKIAIPVDLKYFQDLSDTIEKEIGISGSSHNLTVQAIVSGGNGADFVQLLPITLSKTYIKISDNLTASSEGRQGVFDYQVKLGENILYGPVTLTSPAARKTSPIILGPKDTIFTKFIDSLTINYSYRLTSPKPLRQTQTDVMVEAVLENPASWSKTYTLVPPARQSGDVSLSFPLDLTQDNSIFDTIQQETGIPAANRNLTLKATLHTTAQTDAGPIDTTYTQSITTDLRDALLTWSGNLNKSQPGAIEVTQSIQTEGKIMGLPVLWLRIFSGFFAVFFLACLAYYFLRPGRQVKDLVEVQTRQLSQKFKEIIVDVKDWPELEPGQTVLALESLQDLIKVAQGLLKPINHKAEDDKEIFWVNDDANRYEYLLAGGTPKETDQAALSSSGGNVG